jgi:uncharacterized membrane protein
MTSLRLPTVLSLLALAMLAARMGISHSLGYAFFAWNLILAWAALALLSLGESLWLAGGGRGEERRGSLLALGVGALAWLFFPNTIYLVTDLVYAGHGRSLMRWCDAAMIGTFALAGVSLAIVWLERARLFVRERAGEAASWAFSALVWTSSGAGVWLGRVRRWNSWDALLDPAGVLADAVEHFAHPRAHPASWATLLVFAALLAALHVGSTLAPAAPADATAPR